jgi:type I restriction enzyme S subunit
MNSLRVSDVVQFQRGVSWSAHQEHREPGPGRIPVLRIPNIQETLTTSDIVYLSGVSEGVRSRVAASKGWILIVGSNGNPERIGNAVLIDDETDFLFASFLVGIKPDRSQVLERYLLKVLQSEQVRSHLRVTVRGSTGLQNINLPALGNFRIDLPSLQAQGRIVEILDTMDNQIRATDQIIAKLKHAKQGLLNDLLTLGIDSNGQLRDPVGDSHQFHESVLGLVPTDWTVGPLAQFLESTDYGISTSLARSGSIPVLRMNNIVDGEVDTSDLKYSDSPGAQSLLLRPGDVLFNRTNSIEHVGRTGIWRGQLPMCSFASYLVRLTPGVLLRSEYLNRILNLPSQQKALRRWATPGVHQVNVNPTNLGRVVIAVPNTLEEQDAICTTLSHYDAVIRRETREAGKLRALRAGTASDLLSGRVDVSMKAAK